MVQSFIDVPFVLLAWLSGAVLLAANAAVIFWAPLSIFVRRRWRVLRRRPAPEAGRDTDPHDGE